MSTASKTTLNSAQLDQLSINTIRFLSVDAVQKANSGHPGLPLGAAPMAYVLWTRFLRHNPAIRIGPIGTASFCRPGTVRAALQLAALHWLRSASRPDQTIPPMGSNRPVIRSAA